MSSLQEQLLKAGLTTKDKVTKVNSAKKKQAKINRKHKIDSVDEAKKEAIRVQQQQAEKARQLNQQKNAAAEEKAIQAQIRQLIEMNQQDLGDPVISFNFSDNGAIKKLEVSNLIHKHLTNGQLAVAKLDKSYALVPKAVAEKINLRSSNIIVVLNENKETSDLSKDDPYAEYQIPDDLMW